MYNYYDPYQSPYNPNIPMHVPGNMCSVCNAYQCPYCTNMQKYSLDLPREYAEQYIPFEDEMDYGYRTDFTEEEMDYEQIELKDYGPEPFAVNINEASKQNDTFRTALWTGKHLQVTLMSINVGDEIGLENHPNLDQFIRIEEGEGIVKMGNTKENLDFQENVYDDFAFVIPAGKWHNLINTGDVPLKLYSIYAPPQHPRGTVHETKADAMAAEEHHG